MTGRAYKDLRENPLPVPRRVQASREDRIRISYENGDDGPNTYVVLEYLDHRGDWPQAFRDALQTAAATLLGSIERDFREMSG